MTRRYLALFAVVVVLALVLAFVAHRPQAAPPDVRATAAPAVTEWKVEVTHGAIAPATCQWPKGQLVHLIVVNADAKPVRVTLMGYEDEVDVSGLAAGATWERTFALSRPGEAFAWLVDGEPAGRVAVVGSHLEEGHR